MADQLRSLSPGDRIGGLIIDRLLGAGSFGITYLATDPGLRRKLAIKEFFPQKYARRDDSGTIVPNSEAAQATFEWALDRFSDEAKILARFSHPNIVRVIDFIPELHRTAYIIMEYVEGETLDSWVANQVAKGGLPGRAEALSIFRQLLDGCSAMHRIGILHRDIKPKNIMLRTEQGDVQSGTDSRIVPVLIDFGSSRDLALQQDGFSALVTDGFSPPEQYSRNSTQGEPADLYALACTFYFVLTGKEPPNASARLVEPVEPVPAERVALFGNTLVRAVLAAMELQVGKRPKSISEWRTMLCIDGADDHSRSAPRLRVGRRTLLAGGALAVVGAVGSAAWMLSQGSLLSGFARPLKPAWQNQLGRIFPDSFPQVRIAANGGALIAANAIGDDGNPVMRALRIESDGRIAADWRDGAAGGMATAILPAGEQGTYVGGSVNGKIVLVRLDPQWRESWRKEFDEGGVTALLPIDTGVILGVEGPDFSGARIVAVDPNGKLLWRKEIDKGKSETIQRLIALEDGGYAALGWGVERRDTGEGSGVAENYAFVSLLDAEWKSTNRPQTTGLGSANGWAIAEVDGILYVTGYTSDGREDSPQRMFVWAIEKSGATRWIRWDYPAAPSGGRGLSSAGDGLLYVGGWSGEQQRMRLGQVGPNGDLIWDDIAPAIGRNSAVLDIAARAGGSGYAVGAAQVSGATVQLTLTKLDS